MLKFSAASGIGLSISGSMNLVTRSSDGWPVINMLMSYHPVSGLYHVELKQPVFVDSSAADLAKMLCTVRNRWPAWFLVQRDDIATSPIDSSPVYSPQLVAMMGSHPLPPSRSGCLEALLGSYSCNPINPARQEGFAVNFVNVHDLTASLIEFNQPATASRIGKTSNRVLWTRFRLGGSTFRAKVGEGFEHPAGEVVPATDPAKRVKVGATVASERQWRNNV
jgi:hypothetical protein